MICARYAYGYLLHLYNSSLSTYKAYTPSNAPFHLTSTRINTILAFGAESEIYTVEPPPMTQELTTKIKRKRLI